MLRYKNSNKSKITILYMTNKIKIKIKLTNHINKIKVIFLIFIKYYLKIIIIII